MLVDALLKTLSHMSMLVVLLPVYSRTFCTNMHLQLNLFAKLLISACIMIGIAVKGPLEQPPRTPYVQQLTLHVVAKIMHQPPATINSGKSELCPLSQEEMQMGRNM